MSNPPAPAKPASTRTPKKEHPLFVFAALGIRGRGRLGVDRRAWGCRLQRAEGPQPPQRKQRKRGTQVPLPRGGAGHMVLVADATMPFSHRTRKQGPAL